jgi:hypothetical protein
MSLISISLLCISFALLIAVVISRLVKKGEKIDESMTDKSITLKNLITFSLENAVKNFSKYLALIIIAGIPLGIGIGITFLLPSSIEIVGWLLVLLLAVIVSFGSWKNTLNLCQGKEMDLMAFVKIKPKPMLNLFIVVVYLILICIGMAMPFIYEEIEGDYKNVPFILFFLTFLFFYFFLLSIFAPVLVIDRNVGPIKAIKESIKLTKGYRVKIFLGFFLCGLVTKIVTVIIFTIINVLILPITIEEAKGWESLISFPISFIFVLCLANAYLKLTGQLNETDEANGEMRNEP